MRKIKRMLYYIFLFKVQTVCIYSAVSLRHNKSANLEMNSLDPGFFRSFKPDCQLTLLLTFQVGQRSNGPLALCQTPFLSQRDKVPKWRPHHLHSIMYRVTFHWVSSRRKRIWKGLDPQEHLHETADRPNFLDFSAQIRPVWPRWWAEQKWSDLTLNDFYREPS